MSRRQNRLHHFQPSRTDGKELNKFQNARVSRKQRLWLSDAPRADFSQETVAGVSFGINHLSPFLEPNREAFVA